jgi:hypothetical protein
MPHPESLDSTPATISERLNPDTVARVTGGFLLAYFVASIAATMLGQLGSVSPQQIHDSLVTDAWTFRVGITVALVSALLFALTAWGLYILLRPVDRSLAVLFLLLNAIGVAIQCASLLWLVSALVQQAAASTPQALSADQLDGIAELSIAVYTTGMIAAQLFFGAWLFPLGLLVFASRFLPRFLGVLLMLDGVGVLIWFFQGMLAPAFTAISYPGLAVSFVAELGLALWLLIWGVGPRRRSIAAKPS